MKYLLATSAAFLTAGANAALIIDTEPGNLAGTENILLNGGLLNQGPVVQGLTEETQLVIDFFDAGEELIAGNARVEATDGMFTDLSIGMNDPSLGIAAYEFNLDALGDGDVTISLFDHGVLSLSETFSLSEQGPNWFRVYGTEGEAISSIVIDSTVDITRIKNQRGLAVPNPVPEPAGFVALGLGLVMLAGLRKRL